MARIFRGHPFVYVPEVIPSLSRERVMVSEFVSGTGFEELKRADAATRDRVAEIVFRFYFGCMYRHHQFSGDPHPGNFMLLADGKRRLPRLRPLQAPAAGDRGVRARRSRAWASAARASALIALLHAGGFLAEPDRYTPEQILGQFEDVTWWYTRDGVVELTPEIATQVVIDMSDPRSRHYAQMRHENLPADHLFGRRTETLTLAVMSQLRATRQLAPDRPRMDLRRPAGDRARPRRGRLLRRPYTRWICSMLVVPGTPLGSPAVMPTR